MKCSRRGHRALLFHQSMAGGGWAALQVMGRLLVALLALFWPALAPAEQAVSRRMTLKEAAQHALERHPAVEAAQHKESAAMATVDAVRAEASPRVSLLGQLNRSTGNVVPGAAFAMPGIPAVAGPPGASRSGLGAWQSAAGLTASWDALELLRRPVLLGAARAETTAAQAQSGLSRLVVVARVVDAYLLAIEAQALRRAVDASEKRTQTYRAVVAALVEQKLRPDIDLARVEADLAAARVQVERARLGETVASLRLAESIGEPEWSVEVAGVDLADLPPAPSEARGAHPAVTALTSAARTAEARASVAMLGRLPKVEFLGAAWLRGGGYVLGGPNSGLSWGLVPETPNWAFGVVATWTPTDLGGTRARARVEEAEAAVQRARAAEMSESLTVEIRAARAAHTSALAISREASTAVAFAKKALDLAGARYAQALGNVVEVAEAERALAAAERDDALARLGIWRAVAAIHRARGDAESLAGMAGKGKG